MYCVVETIEEGERNSTAVPCIWVDKLTLRYPSQSKEVNIARKKCTLPKADWIEMPCTILRDNIETLKEALEKERETTIISCSENEASSTRKQLQCENNNVTGIFLQNLDNNNPSPPNASNLSTPVNSSPSTFSYASNIPDASDATSTHQQQISSNYNYDNLSNPHYAPQHYGDSLCQRLDIAINICQTQTDKILKNQAVIQVSLDLLLEKIPGPKLNQNFSEKPDYELPITTVESLDCCENAIKTDPEFRRQMIAYMSTFGGPHALGFARNIMKIFINDKTLSEFSWTGSGHSNKKPFLPYKEVQHVLLQAVRRKFSEYTDHDNNRFLKDYLKSANTRLIRAAERTKTS